MNDLMKRLQERAYRGIHINIIACEGKRYLPAGSHQFRTLWTRDFCYSIPGLLILGERQLVKDQLMLYWTLINHEGLLPRGVDVINPKLRVVANLIPTFEKLTHTRTFDYQKRPLRPEFLGEHGTPCIDSNLLVIEGSLRYLKETKDPEFQKLLTEKLPQALGYYQRFKTPDGFLHQPPYSDWQDSLKRDRPTLTTHLLYRRMLKLSEGTELSSLISAHSPLSLSTLEEMIYQRFLRKTEWTKQSFEALLWLIEDPLPLFSFEPVDLLRLYPLNTVGVPNSSLARETISWTTRLVGLQGYHLTLRWSWLMAEAARILGQHDRKYSIEILTQLDSLSERKGFIGEIYDEGGDFSTLLYRSEVPFTWGSAKLIEAISALKN